MRFHVKHILVAAVAAMVYMPHFATAAVVDVDTSGGLATENTWTVADPDAGNYSVLVSGYGKRDLESSKYYYRNLSNSGEDDGTITWAVSGLDPSASISSFSLDTVKVTPTVGSGNANYTLTLSATDVDTSLTVSSVQTITNGSGTPVLAIAGDFGNAPVFSLAIHETSPYTSRTIGTYSFHISAETPEPVTLSALGLFGMLGLRRRR